MRLPTLRILAKGTGEHLAREIKLSMGGYSWRPSARAARSTRAAKFGCNFRPEQVRGHTFSSCNYRDSCKSDFAVDVCKEILGVEFYHDISLRRSGAVNALPAS
jgi:hypothetical protein